MKAMDVKGKFVFPGFIDAHSHIGIPEEKTTVQGDESNESTNLITPCLRGIDAINPMDSASSVIATIINGEIVWPNKK